jgi:hypothetical protein
MYVFGGSSPRGSIVLPRSDSARTKIGHPLVYLYLMWTHSQVWTCSGKWHNNFAQRINIWPCTLLHSHPPVPLSHNQFFSSNMPALLTSPPSSFRRTPSPRPPLPPKSPRRQQSLGPERFRDAQEHYPRCLSSSQSLPPSHCGTPPRIATPPRRISPPPVRTPALAPTAIPPLITVTYSFDDLCRRFSTPFSQSTSQYALFQRSDRQPDEIAYITICPGQVRSAVERDSESKREAHIVASNNNDGTAVRILVSLEVLDKKLLPLTSESTDGTPFDLISILHSHL